MILDIFEGSNRLVGTVVIHRDNLDDLKIKDDFTIKALCFWDDDDGKGNTHTCHLCRNPKARGWLYMQDNWTGFACVSCLIGN